VRGIISFSRSIIFNLPIMREKPSFSFQKREIPLV
jgi:hypothetical protein